jgi:23S rRNA (cytosine1962-C5)-methyltransferase
MQKNYLLIDSGNGKKLEQIGEHRIVRPSSSAIWAPFLEKALWDKADAYFSRDDGKNWYFKNKIPSKWHVEINGLKFIVSPTDFGHLGIFPEHLCFFPQMEAKIKSKKNPSILNLFAYTGGATLLAARAGASVCHVDASSPTVLWARENAKLNGLEKAPIRWIVDDVFKFLRREIKRGVKYDGIILDPPSFGRGTSGQVFKIEKDLSILLEMCKSLFSSDPLFLLFTCHTPGMTPTVLYNLLFQTLEKGKISAGEMLLSSTTHSLPCGSYSIWENEHA